MDLVLLWRTNVYQYIVKKKKNQHKFPEAFFKGLINKGLKGSWSIGEAKWHDQKFIVAFVSSEVVLGMSSACTHIW